MAADAGSGADPGASFDADSIDPGLASERTDLAWNRSGLALAGCGLAVLRGMTVGDPIPARIGIGSLILALGAVVWVLGAWQAHHRRGPGLARRVARAGDLLPVAVGTAAVGAAAFVLGLFFPV